MTIDNFDVFRSHLTFQKAKKFDSKTGKLEEINDTYDRYVVQILQRSKDQNGKHILANTSSRLLKTYEISSLEYFDEKRQHIIDICKTNNARAYITPQVRSTYDCLKEMLKIGIDNLENPTVKFQHILRSCLCSMHKSRDKKWILDLDEDNMIEYIKEKNGDITKKKWGVNEVLELVKKQLQEIGKDPNDAYVSRTVSGNHIITSPFDLKKAFSRCSMMYEGEQKREVERRYTGPDESEMISKNIVGWLHKDGLSLLYYSKQG